VTTTDNLSNPDAAWQRMISSSNIQLAIKTSLAGSPRFFFKAWADNGTADPAKFDYNDSYSEIQACSPDNSNSIYLVGQVFLADSTCWVAFNFQPKGTELGGCYQVMNIPARIKKPTKGPVPQCPSNCVGIMTLGCCERCGSDYFYNNGFCQAVPIK
jgi:hypothetical protein